MAKIRNESYFCKPHEVVSLKALILREGATITWMAETLGVARTHFTQMLNQQDRMRRVYRYAIVAVLAELRRSRARDAVE